MKVGDEVKYIHDNSYDNNSYMLLRNSTGVVAMVTRKYDKEYVEVCFDEPIYEGCDDRHYFCLTDI